MAWVLPAQTGALFNVVQILAPDLLTDGDRAGDTITRCVDLTAQLAWFSDPVIRGAAGIQAQLWWRLTPHRNILSGGVWKIVSGVVQLNGANAELLAKRYRIGTC